MVGNLLAASRMVLPIINLEYSGVLLASYSDIENKDRA